MDIVDLDKVLDELEEDEERISDGHTNSANGFVQGPGVPNNPALGFNISINDKYGDIPFPQQVSHEPPTPDSPLYNDSYAVPYKLTENLKLSDADFGFSPKLPDLKESSKEIREEDYVNSINEGTPDINTVTNLLQNNGIAEIQDINQFITPQSVDTLSNNFSHESILSSNSSLGSTVSGDPGFVSAPTPHENGGVSSSTNLTTEIHNDSLNSNDFILNQSLDSSLSSSSKPEETTDVKEFLDSDSAVLAVVNGIAGSPIANGRAESESESGISVTPFAEPVSVVGFSENINMTDDDIMAYLDETDALPQQGNSAPVMSIYNGPQNGGQSDENLGQIMVDIGPQTDQAKLESNLTGCKNEEVGNFDCVDSMDIASLEVNDIPDYTTTTTQNNISDCQPLSVANSTTPAKNVGANMSIFVQAEGIQNDNCASQNENSLIIDSQVTSPDGSGNGNMSVIVPSHATSAIDNSVSTSNPEAGPDTVAVNNDECSPVVNDTPSVSSSSNDQLTSHSGVSNNLNELKGPDISPYELSTTSIPSSTTGETPPSTSPGVKPKEGTKMKRPSSLLGLSTVALPVASTAAKSQSLPRSFSVGMNSGSAGTVKKPTSLAELTLNGCQGDVQGDVPDSANIPEEPCSEEGVTSDTPVSQQLEELPEYSTPEQGNPTDSDVPFDPAMQPVCTLPSVVIPYGQPPDTSDQSRESRNLPPFLGFPAHLPDRDVEPSSDGTPIYRQTSEGSEESGSEVGAVGWSGPNEPTGLGRLAPVWVPDAEAPNCMQCDSKFTFTKRRHHCRGCGKVFCSTCCSLKSKLEYMGGKEGRVCSACHEHLLTASSSSLPPDRSPNPNNPSEYCSTIPPHQQVNANSPAPTVLVPVGVLKREGSHRRGEPKQVMFSDGIRPGGDLTEVEGVSEARLPVRSGRKVHKVERTSNSEGQSGSSRMKSVKASDSSRWSSLLPAVGLPPIINTGVLGDNPTDESLIQYLQGDTAEPIVFKINPNLQCQVSIVVLDCCVHRKCWCFMSQGLCTAGQEEVVVVLECLPEEKAFPDDIFHHYQGLYEAASKGNTVSEMGHTIFNQPFLGNRDHGGFLYIRPSYQCLLKLNLPPPPFVVAILLQKWEIPWAKVFPIRLLLRLGAEYRYYPCPLISVRNRKPVFFEIGHTIMNLLADFRGYQYMLAQVKGIHIHMEDKKTMINFPKNRYQDLMKVVTSSNEHVMALGANFSMEADSHLVCIQNDEGNYQTQAINIQNKPRKVTGASFVVFNGALKTASGLTAKSSIVEDGLMVQISPDSMAALKQSIKDMKNYSIACGSVTSAKPDEVITIQWVEDDKAVNVGVRSPIDNIVMDGIPSVHIHNSTDYLGENRVIRWTEVFFIQNKDSAKLEPIDLSRLAESLAQAGCIALTPHLDTLHEANLTKIGLRATIDSGCVGYEVGSKGEKLPDRYMVDLDNELIPVIYNAASLSQEEPIILELIFFVLN